MQWGYGRKNNHTNLSTFRNQIQVYKWILASVIFGMTVCSIKADNCASTRTRPGKAFSSIAPSAKPCTWITEELFLPENWRNWSSSCLKKVWNPSWTKSTNNSLCLTKIPESSSKILRKPWRERDKM